MNSIDQVILSMALWIKMLIETVSILFILLGAVTTLYNLFNNYRNKNPDTFSLLKEQISRYLVIALEFMLAADIVATAVSPSWDQIGKLGAIALIRTFLNFFLQWEMKNTIFIK